MLINTTLQTATLLCEKPVRVRTSYLGLASVQAQSAPMSATHGTGLSAASFIGTDVADVPGSPPREAPV